MTTQALLADRYTPSRLDQLTFHPDINEALQSLANSKEMPHLLIAGPRGSGKMTRIRCLLAGIFDANIAKMRIDDRVFQTTSGRKIEVTVFSSNHHVEVNPSDAGIYDRIVIQDIIKDIAQSQQVDRLKGPFKVAVISDADRLTKDAQQALRRTMEKFSSNIRLILCCNSSSRIMDPIKSRCLQLRVPAPSDSQIHTALLNACRDENFTIGPHELEKIVEHSDGNFRKALLLTEMRANQDSTICFDWESALQQVARDILTEKSPAGLLAMRGRLYELLGHGLAPSLIIKSLALLLLPSTGSPMASREVILAASLYEHRASKGNKALFHIEAFVARAMSIFLAHS